MNLAPGCEPRCPGCAHRRKTADESAAQKQAFLAEMLAPWADCLRPVQVVAEAARWNYRDRVCLATAWDEQGWRFGLTVRDDIIAIPDCPVHSARVRALVRTLSAVLPAGREFPLVYYVQAGAQATLVLKTAQKPALDWLTDEVRGQLAAGGLEGLWLHRHPSAGRRILAKNSWDLLWGVPRSRDAGGLVHGPAAFQQLLPVLYNAALAEVGLFLAPTADSAVVDLYCGAGASLRCWLQHGAQVVGVELGGEAVACARANAPAAEIYRGACAQRLPQLDQWLAAQPGERLLYVNPPRTGLEPDVLDWIMTRLRPARMGYLSCSAGTLSRDLQALTKAGYAVDRLSPYDFFPQTYHVEKLVLLRRLD